MSFALANDSLVTVTGASGFVAMHCISQLLEANKRVRGTLRTPARAEAIREALERHLGREIGAELSFVRADLLQDEGWPAAMNGADALLHLASPLPRRPPKHPDDLIIPARDGALRALRAAHGQGVGRIVMTSSVAAIGYGQPLIEGQVFTHEDWSRPVDGVGAYEQSKTIAERAAWDWFGALDEGGRPHFATICPGVVLGPILDEDYGTSGELVRKLLARELPGCPDVRFLLVDVRDVARAHLLALDTPAAAGERFIVGDVHASAVEIAEVLKSSFGTRGYKVPTRRLPNLLLRIGAIFDPTARLILNELGCDRRYSSAHTQSVLGWHGRSLQEMTEAMGESMIAFGLV